MTIRPTIIKVSKDTHKRITLAAFEHKLSVSKYVVKILKEYLEEEK